MSQTIILRSDQQRNLARQMIEAAPQDAVVRIAPQSRSLDQNALLWAILSDVARSKPMGRCHTAEVWKELFCHACGHAVQFEIGLNGQPFPTGFRTSKMSKAQMADLITFILAWGDEQGVRWSQ
jgi:hypothetical protein